MLKGILVVDKQLDQKHYLNFCQFLEKNCGIVLGDSKQYLVRSRLSPLVTLAKLDSLNSFIELVLRGDRKFQEWAIEAMTTNETLWFRDNYPFELLKKTVLGQFKPKSRPLRVWSAACSSGQEAYSIAMTILNYQQAVPGSFSSGVEILGTDISQEMLDRSRAGEYDKLALARGLPAEFKKDFFEQGKNGNFKLNNKVKALTKFTSFNLLGNYSSLGRFDIIYCRNVLIYFSPTVKKQILQKIAACLQDNGVLFLGASESISDLTDIFTMVRCNPGLYYRKNPR
jgi:chemotaxis protein methyltransferase CheR